MRRQAFYDLANSTDYPFDDASSLIDRDGKRLPEGLLCDASFVIDAALAHRVYCSSVTKRGGFCTMVFSAMSEARPPVGYFNFDLARTSLDFATGESPQQAVSPLVSGFRGRLVLGSQWGDVPDGNWNFDEPRDSLLAARCCFPLRLPAGQLFLASPLGSPLSGMVNLVPEGDMTIQITDRYLDGRTRRAVVFGLRPEADILTSYAGENQQRPENRTCGDPQPVETINNVGADCCGRIFIELRGCAQPIPITNHSGVVLECPLTLEEICPATPNYAAEDSPDNCLAGGAVDPLNPPTGLPVLPPNWRTD